MLDPSGGVDIDALWARQDSSLSVRLFGVDPDQHTGGLELLVAGAFLMTSMLLARQARRDWRIHHQGELPRDNPG